MNTNDFLPQGYEAPASSSHYLKLAEGETKFRIISKPVIGWLDWKDNKPLRYKMDSKPDKPVDPSKAIRHFWAFMVWSYSNNAVMILEVTQSTIQRMIQDLISDKDWGSPFTYDLKVIRKGKEKNTEYSIVPSNKKAIDDSIYKQCLEANVCLDELFVNGDPFASQKKATQIELDPLQ